MNIKILDSERVQQLIDEVVAFQNTIFANLNPIFHKFEQDIKLTFDAEPSKVDTDKWGDFDTGTYVLKGNFSAPVDLDTVQEYLTTTGAADESRTVESTDPDYLAPFMRCNLDYSDDTVTQKSRITLKGDVYEAGSGNCGFFFLPSAASVEDFTYGNAFLIFTSTEAIITYAQEDEKHAAHVPLFAGRTFDFSLYFDNRVIAPTMLGGLLYELNGHIKELTEAIQNNTVYNISPRGGGLISKDDGRLVLNDARNMAGASKFSITAGKNNQITGGVNGQEKPNFTYGNEGRLNSQSDYSAIGFNTLTEGVAFTLTDGSKGNVFDVDYDGNILNQGHLFIGAQSQQNAGQKYIYTKLYKENEPVKIVRLAIDYDTLELSVEQVR